MYIKIRAKEEVMKIALVEIRTHNNKRDVHESDAQRIELTQAMQTVDVSLYLSYPPICLLASDSDPSSQ